MDAVAATKRIVDLKLRVLTTRANVRRELELLETSTRIVTKNLDQGHDDPNLSLHAANIDRYLLQLAGMVRELALLEERYPAVPAAPLPTGPGGMHIEG